MIEKYLIIALEEAKKAYKMGEIPIGAVIVKDDHVIGYAHNLKETTQCAVKHAEIIAIEKASMELGTWRLLDCDLYVTMEPCIMCCGALSQARIRNVYYIVDNNKFGGTKILKNDKSYEHINHVVNYINVDNFSKKQEYVKLLQDFFIEKR